MKKWIITGLLLTALAIGVGAAKTPRNFIVILADDLGYGDMGCFRELYQGGDDRTLAHEFTPNLDKLAQEGVRFTQAYTCSWCAPSRQNLLSGRWCNRADNISRNHKF